MITLHIDGMHCGACVRRVRARLEALPNTRVDTVEVGSARLESSEPHEALLAAVTAAGFSATVDRP